MSFSLQGVCPEKKTTYYCYHIVQVTWICVVDFHVGSECQRLSSSCVYNSCEGRTVPCELVRWLCVACLSRAFSVTFWTLGRQESGLACFLQELSYKLAASRIWKESFMVKAVNITVGLDFISSGCLLMVCSPFCGILFGAAEIRFILLQESQWVLCLLPWEVRSQTSQKWMSHISGHLSLQFLSLIFLRCFLICSMWKILFPFIVL